MTEAVKERLDNWKPWMIVAYFGLVFCVVGLYVLQGRTTRAVSLATKNEAIRIADIRSSATSAHGRCLAGSGVTKKINRGLVALHDLTDAQVQNAEGIIALTPPGELRDQRLENLRRTKKALRNLPTFPIPTKSECDAIYRAALAAAK